jgi:hypothetical protein
MPFGGTPAGGTALAPSHHTVLRYVDRFTPAPSSGSVFTQVYNLRSLYDPDYTSTGHQPLLFDNYAALYKYYTVTRADVRVACVDTNASASASTWEVGMAPCFNPSDLAAMDPETVGEQPNGFWKVIVPHNSDASRNTISASYDTLALMGIPHGLARASNIAAGVTASPSWPLYLTMTGQVVDETTTMSGVYVYVEIDFHCDFFLRDAFIAS